MEEIAKIINDIREKNGLDPILNIQKNDDLQSILGLTSMDLAELTAIIEDKYDIDIFENGFVRTIDDILKQINH